MEGCRPSWLAGAFCVNLWGNPYSEEMYEVLLNNLHGTPETAPPVGTRPTARSGARSAGLGQSPPVTHQPSAAVESWPDKINTILLNEIGTPRWDGAAGSSLYTVPFQLSRPPSLDWQRHFIETWNHPPSYSTRHRPHTARIVGDRLILEETTVDEIEKYHEDTLKAVLDRGNTDSPGLKPGNGANRKSEMNSFVSTGNQSRSRPSESGSTEFLSQDAGI